MNCQDFELIAGELADDQLLSAKTRVSALAHAESCEQCARRVASERMLSAGLNALAERTASEAPARVKQSLRAAFDAQTPRAAPAPMRGSLRGHRTGFSLSTLWGQAKVPPTLAIATAAAVMVLAVTLSVWLRGSSLKTTEVIFTATPTPTAIPVQPTETNLAGHEEVKAERRSLARRRTRTSEDEAASYIPLTYAVNAEAPQDKLVVRVEVPRATLIGMGLPLDAEPSSELVKADLMVGVDGVPLAIRFVKPIGLTQTAGARTSRPLK